MNQEMGRRLVFSSTGLVFLLSVSAGVPVSRAEEFQSNRLHYSLQLPDGWIQIPDDVLAQMQSAILNDKSRGIVHFDVGFQPGTHESWFSVPYVLVQHISYQQLGVAGQPAEDLFEDIVKAITGVDAQTAFDEVASDDVKQHMSALTAGSPVIDVRRRRYDLAAHVSVANVGRIKAEGTGFFGRDGVVQVMFYCLDANCGDSADDCRRFKESFAFHPDFAYDPSAAVVSRSPSTFKKVITYSAITGVGAGLLAALLSLLKFSRREDSGAS